MAALPPPLDTQSCAVTQSNSTLIRWLHTSDGILARIEVFVVVSAALLIFLAVLGSYRRRSSNGTLKFMLWAAYTLADLLVAYTIGLMDSVNFRNELFMVWASFLLLVLGTANSISAYSLEDNEQWKRHKIQQLLLLCCFYHLKT